MSCDEGHRQGSDPTLLWLWCRLAATAPIRTLAWEPTYAMVIALKKKKKKKKKKRNSSPSSRSNLPVAHEGSVPGWNQRSNRGMQAQTWASKLRAANVRGRHLPSTLLIKTHYK